jgi:hypothetical protein
MRLTALCVVTLGAAGLLAVSALAPASAARQKRVAQPGYSKQIARPPAPPAPAQTCLLDDGYGRLRSCASGGGGGGGGGGM